FSVRVEEAAICEQARRLGHGLRRVRLALLHLLLLRCAARQRQPRRRAGPAEGAPFFVVALAQTHDVLVVEAALPVVWHRLGARVKTDDVLEIEAAPAVVAIR